MERGASASILKGVQESCPAEEVEDISKRNVICPIEAWPQSDIFRLEYISFVTI